MVTDRILTDLRDAGWHADRLKRLWLHEANKAANDFIGRTVLGRVPTKREQPDNLQDGAEPSSAGSLIAVSQHSGDLVPGDRGVICSFGAGYSDGSVPLARA
jgi:beta-ketodecanoyl-[acyl-carrier-protein] synthase